MPLFVCPRCRGIENTALGHFWAVRTRRPAEVRCSECHTGTWHGEWEKEIYDGTQDVFWVGEMHA